MVGGGRGRGPPLAQQDNASGYFVQQICVRISARTFYFKTIFLMTLELVTFYPTTVCPLPCDILPAGNLPHDFLPSPRFAHGFA
jgi:hypothetical protein